MLRIAVISDHASPLAAPGSVDCGGQNVYVDYLARELAAMDCKVDVFTRRDHPGQAPVVPWHDNVRVIQVPAGPACHVPKEQMLPLMEVFTHYMTRFAQCQSTPYDVVHANFFMSGLVAQQVWRQLGTPFVITFHALGMVRRLLQGPADGFPDERLAIERALMRDAERIIAECPQDCADMEALYGADSSRIDIVPCGFDPDELWPVRSEARQVLGLDPGEFVVLQLGRMVPRKGIDNVIEAVGVLTHEYNIRARLLVVGGDAPPGDGQETPELRRLMGIVERLGLQQQVTFTGPKPREALRFYYSAADVFATTPWYEPFGITPLESMACATPVIGAAVGGIKSTVLDGQTGYLVPPSDPQALAARLALLHANPAHARALGEEGWRRVHRLYTWHSVAERIAGIYAAVAERQTAARAASH
jgi:hypothetical protein